MGALSTLGTMTARDARNLGLFSKRKIMGMISNMLGDIYVMQIARGRLLGMAGARIGYGVRIRAPIHVENPKKLAIGAGSFVNKEMYLDNTGADITIGDHAIIGFRVSMTTSNHDLRTRETVSKPIAIGDGVWIGAGSTILPGAVVGSGAVIASGAVVAGNVAPHTVVGGVPAKVIKKVD